MVVKNSGQGQIFNHPVLEKLTTGHAYVPITMHFVISSALLIYCFVVYNITPVMLAAYSLGGLLFWTLFEYLAHRYIFHMDTATRIREKVQYAFHRVHHEYPARPRPDCDAARPQLSAWGCPHRNFQIGTGIAGICFCGGIFNGLCFLCTYSLQYSYPHTTA